jgi:hypothetical protein
MSLLINLCSTKISLAYIASGSEKRYAVESRGAQIKVSIEIIIAISAGLLCGFLNTVASSRSAVTLSLLFLVGLSLSMTNAQAVYNANSQYKGYTQTSPSGDANTYNSMGQNVGSSQIDNGQRNFYTHNGAYQGTNTTPAYIAPNTPISIPRQAPQAPTIKGW